MNPKQMGLLALLMALPVGVVAVQEGSSLGPKDGLDLPPTDIERVRVGDMAPDFTLESKDSGPVTLSSYRGKKNVVLVFYRGHW